MAKAIRTKGRTRRSLADDHLPFAKQNFMIVGAGLAAIVLGYAAMAEGSVEGFLPLVAAPILLLLGYCVLIPLGILYRPSMFSRQSGQSAPSQQQPA